jgi:hypothetical protein
MLVITQFENCYYPLQFPKFRRPDIQNNFVIYSEWIEKEVSDLEDEELEASVKRLKKIVRLKWRLK